ncbi:putative lipoprotein [Neisseria gonorrhoeae]|uniref:Putative lipoprotein n=1 Tax=Neisseria gonorrhoeae TaxID=485 RepID=A0A378W170_NEIGO|nr:putative lipoprotein [Neisseria gonorrhoeae]
MLTEYGNETNALAVGVAAVLAGCGKDAGGYEGYWREKSDKKRA